MQKNDKRNLKNQLRAIFNKVKKHHTKYEPVYRSIRNLWALINITTWVVEHWDCIVAMAAMIC